MSDEEAEVRSASQKRKPSRAESESEDEEGEEEERADRGKADAAASAQPPGHRERAEADRGADGLAYSGLERWPFSGGHIAKQLWIEARWRYSERWRVEDKDACTIRLVPAGFGAAER